MSKTRAMCLQLTFLCVCAMHMFAWWHEAGAIHVLSLAGKNTWLYYNFYLSCSWYITMMYLAIMETQPFNNCSNCGGSTFQQLQQLWRLIFSTTAAIIETQLFNNCSNYGDLNFQQLQQLWKLNFSTTASIVETQLFNNCIHYYVNMNHVKWTQIC